MRGMIGGNKVVVLERQQLVFQPPHGALVSAIEVHLKYEVRDSLGAPSFNASFVCHTGLSRNASPCLSGSKLGGQGSGMKAMKEHQTTKIMIKGKEGVLIKQIW